MSLLPCDAKDIIMMTLVVDEMRHTKYIISMTFVQSKHLRPSAYPRRARAAALLELAHRQGGYFTALQAQALGYVKNNHPRQVKAGSWLREGHGLYRLAVLPQLDPALAELHLWLLWTIRRGSETPQGALAYETALVVQGLTDLILDDIHLWVPADFRARKVPQGIVMHRRARPASEVTVHQGLRVVRPLPTLIDLLVEGRVSEEHIQRGLFDGVERGSIERTEVADAADAIPRNAHARRLYSWLLQAEPQVETLLRRARTRPTDRGNDDDG